VRREENCTLPVRARIDPEHEQSYYYFPYWITYMTSNRNCVYDASVLKSITCFKASCWPFGFLDESDERQVIWQEQSILPWPNMFEVYFAVRLRIEMSSLDLSAQYWKALWCCAVERRVIAPPIANSELLNAKTGTKVYWMEWEKCALADTAQPPRYYFLIPTTSCNLTSIAASALFTCPTTRSHRLVERSTSSRKLQSLLSMYYPFA
jgi:hypothetical protein